MDEQPQDLNSQPMQGEGSSEGTELNPTNAFGELLLDLIEAQFADLNTDPEDTTPAITAGIQALVQATGLPEEDVVGFISGENIVDDADILEAIISAFPDANDEDIETIIEVASGVEEEDRMALEAQYENEGDVEPDMANQQAAEYAAAYNPQIQANFNRSIVEELQKIRQEKEALEANFAQANFEAELSNYLAEFDSRLSADVANQVLSPAMKEALIGNFTNPKQRLAQFTAIAQENGARDLREQLNMSEFAYSFLKNIANVVEFKDYSVSEEDVAVANFSSSLEKAAEADLDAIGLDLTSLGL